MAPLPANRATPVDRAGFTEVLVTGMLIRWIRVRPRPIAIGAKPAGALLWVAPMMMTRNIAVITTSRSEERRVGKECRSRRSPYHTKKQQNAHAARRATG